MIWKKILCVITAIAVAAGMLTTTLYIERRQNMAAAANAGESITVGDFTYRVNPDGETVTVTYYSGNSDNIVIPSTVTDNDGNEYTVTEIGNGSTALTYLSTSFTVTIPNTVTKINDNAFANNWGLSSITIPGSVTTIGDYAFNGCYYFKDLIIENGVQEIGNFSFYQCGTLTSVNIPDSVKSIGTGAFRECRSLSTATIGNGVDSIGDLAFCNCVITSIDIPSSVTYIGGHAFTGTQITSVTIPATVQTLGTDMFSDCDKLENVKIEEGVRTIPNYMFFGCKSLKTVEIPNSIISIGDGAFQNCSQLTDIDIPNSVTSIGQKAFHSSGLTSIDIPESVGAIGDHAFENCLSLSKANIPANIVVIGDTAFPATYYGPNWSGPFSTAITYNGTKAQWAALYPKPTGDYINNLTFAGGVGDPIIELPAPTGLSYVSLDETSVLISWKPVAGASKYVFLYCQSDFDDGHKYSNWNMVYIPSNSIDEYGKVTIELKGLARNQQYALTVAAIDEEGTVGKLYHEPGDKHFTFKAVKDPNYNNIQGPSHPIFEDPGLSSFQPQIIIKKVDKDTQGPLADAVFSVYTDRACTKLLKTETTNENGEAVFNISIDEWLKNQMYYIKETEAPSGYKISDTVFKAEFDADKAQRGKIAAFYSVPGSADPETTTPPVFENESDSTPDNSDPNSSDPDSSSTPTPPSTPTLPPYNPPPTSSDPDSSDPESPDPNSSNPGTSEPESSEPESSEPENSEPESIPPNPSTGSALALVVPAILVGGAMVIAALKRRK